MAYDEQLAQRVRRRIETIDAVVEKHMFGGVAYLVHGNMSVGVLGGELIVRLDPGEALAALREPGARPFDLTGRPTKGWLYVSAEALGDDRVLAGWVRRGVEFAATLPPKAARAAPAERRRRKTPAAGTALAELPNLGPKSAAMLAAAGIETFGQLKRLGSVAAYARVRRSNRRASLNLLWALEGALTGLPWQVVAREHHTSLLLALEAFEG